MRAHETYNGGDPNGGSLVIGNFPTYTDSNEWQFTNNTCNQTGEELVTGFRNFMTGAPMKNFLVRNNLFINLNEYVNTPVNQPYNSARVYRENSRFQLPGRRLFKLGWQRSKHGA